MNRFEWIRSHAYGKIVDIGCNQGQMFTGTPMAPNVIGVDMDMWTPPYGLGFVQADAHKLPFKDGEFNCAVLCEILEHVKDPVQVLKEARRVVNGCVYFTIPYEHNWDPKYQPMMTLDERIKVDKTTYESLFKKGTTDNPECKGAVDDKTNPHLWHVRYYTLDMLCADIEKAGFVYKIELLQYDGWSFFVGMLR